MLTVMRIDSATVETLQRQLGLITRQQLLRHGYADKQTDAMLRRGHLERVGHGVYRRTGVGHSPQQEALAAVLRCRPQARITGPRILGFLGLRGSDPGDAFSVLVPSGRTVTNVAFPVVRDLVVGEHNARYGAVPGTTPILTLAELARGTMDADQLLSVFDRLRWDGILTRPRLAAGLHDLAERHPGAQRWLRLLDDGLGDPESPPERLLAPLLVSVCPGIELQVWVAPDVRVDALWRDLSIVIEYLGRGTHDDDRDRAADRQREARLRELGYAVIYVCHEDLADADGLRRRLLRARANRRAELAAAGALHDEGRSDAA